MGAGVQFDPATIRAQIAEPIDGGKHGARAAKTLPGQMSLFGDEAGRANIGVGDKQNGQQTALPNKSDAFFDASGLRDRQNQQKSAGVSNEQPALPQATPIDGLFGWQNALQGPNREKVPA